MLSAILKHLTFVFIFSEVQHMKYNINQIRSINDVTALSLSLSSELSLYSLAGITESVSVKFLQSAALLPERAYLGWQMTAENNHYSAVVFSSKESNVTAADFDWIFCNGKTSAAFTPASIQDLFSNGRKVYILSLISGSASDIAASSHDDSYIFDSEYRGRMNDTSFNELLEILSDAGARVRLIAGAADEKDRGHGTILISLKERISLRMRSILSLFFPHTTAYEIDSSSLEKCHISSLPDECLLKSLTRLLYAVAYQKIQERKARESEDELSSELYLD